MSLQTVIGKLNYLIPGWIRYFKLAEQIKATLRDLDGWIRRKIRCYRLKQFKRRYTIIKELHRMGIPEYQAAILASSGKGWWRLSSAPQLHHAMNNK